MSRATRLFAFVLLAPVLLTLAACASHPQGIGSTPIKTVTAAPNAVDHSDGTSQQNPNAAQSNSNLCAWLLGSLQQDGISGELGNASWDGNITVEPSKGKNICSIQPVIVTLGEPAYHAGETTLHIDDPKQPVEGDDHSSHVDVGGHPAYIWFSAAESYMSTSVGDTKFLLNLHLDVNDHTIEQVEYTTSEQFLTDVMGDLLYRWDKGDRPTF